MATNTAPAKPPGLFASITAGKRSRPRRTLLYGVEGVGKSTFGASAPSPIFLPTEDGLDHLEVARFPLLTNWDDFLRALGDLYAEKHSYKTIIIDSLDWLERLIWADVCKEHRVGSVEEIGYGKGYKFALSRWQACIDALDDFRARGIGCVLLAHSQIERFEDPSEQSYDRYTPRLHKAASGIIREWCDEVLFAKYDIIVKAQNEGFNRERARGIGTGERVMFTAERPSHMAKNRGGLPEKLPLDYRAYSQHFEPKDKDKK